MIPDWVIELWCLVLVWDLVLGAWGVPHFGEKCGLSRRPAGVVPLAPSSAAVGPMRQIPGGLGDGSPRTVEQKYASVGRAKGRIEDDDDEDEDETIEDRWRLPAIGGHTQPRGRGDGGAARPLLVLDGRLQYHSMGNCAELLEGRK